MAKLVGELTDRLHRRFLKLARDQGGTASFVIRKFVEDYSEKDTSASKSRRTGPARNPGFNPGATIHASRRKPGPKRRKKATRS